MKAFVMVLLAVAACVLGYLWLDGGRKAQQEGKKYQERIVELEETTQTQVTRIEEAQAASIRLEQDVRNLEEQLQIAATTLTTSSNQITALQSQVSEANEATRKAEAEIAARDEKITKLEVERDGLTKEMKALNGQITQLEEKIANTEAQLAAARGDRSFLLSELTRMQAEKAELERQFTDLAVLREQVNRLQNELAVARRVDLIRSGRYGGQQLKGAQLLRTQQFKRDEVPVSQPSYDLDVELRSDGSAPTISTNRSVTVTPLNP